MDTWFHLATLRAALRLEIAGLNRSRSPSAYSILKKCYGFKGSRQKVLEDLNERIRMFRVQEDQPREGRG